MQNQKIELLQSLLKTCSDLPLRDSVKLDILKQRSITIIEDAFGTKSKYINELKRIRFSPTVLSGNSSSSVFDDAWKNGIEELNNLFNTMIEDIQGSINHEGGKTTQTVSKKSTKRSSGDSNKIFIVHGQNEEMKDSVTRIIEKLGLRSVVLQEQPAKGASIAGLSEINDVEYAIVLFSIDDEKTTAPKSKKQRALQNIVFELGFLIGRLGKEKVFTLCAARNEAELPSDISGVTYHAYDPDGKWQFDLVRELNANGIKVDANKLL